MKRKNQPDRIIMHKIEAREKQRTQQQGFGRPIISGVLNKNRMVAVGNKLMFSNNWKTFPDFLFYYIKFTLGSEWGNAEMSKPLKKQHPIFDWYRICCRQQNENFDSKKEICRFYMNGGSYLYLSLAYYLYLIQHNSRLQELLIKRIKNKSTFIPAYYETFVAACCVTAGFTINYEDETDPITQHCEFIATKDDQVYSVEAKFRMGTKQTVGDPLYKALKKPSEHERIIFIGFRLNITDDDDFVVFADNIIDEIKNKEKNITINGFPAPPAYVFVTNHSQFSNLTNQNRNPKSFIEGFKIDDISLRCECHSLDEALEWRKRHAGVLLIIESMKNHLIIPTTFTGEIPQFEFENSSERIIVGSNIEYIDDKGMKRIGQIEYACVSKSEWTIYAVVYSNGVRHIICFQMTEDEIEAYKLYPDTFFGIYNKEINTTDPVEMYDFFYETYKNSNRSFLLEQLGLKAEDVADTPRVELAEQYCKKLVYAILQKRK